ncbi:MULTISPECIES: hypothetical protein [Stenotrophomonas]|uniref:hypothetical protein n=1 Tax=Stenotrophomonas TaxID=40323 RepID=UPI00080BC75D|nr:MULTISPECIES: hypothetical protein [Stenotrophomonas]ELK2668057.1 hypothetical protein [Stenotrophomonas maltophilia]MBH1377664.1 hypothetical protein [Stenotrophomonas maltophilia]MBH1439506.1 hypothetical protein [Stenotrophomonas maltophilia]MBH1558230.1 hypothetical protein [Stenotrophomonas maltophilia]MBN4988559.1 hypothetical protein [Stenotrophomonas maltophilia]
MSKHSRKAREKLAEGLMSMSGSLAVALTVGVLITPLLAVANAAVAGKDVDLWAMITDLKPTTAAILFLLYCSAVATVLGGRSAAMKIFNELYPDK